MHRTTSSADPGTVTRLLVELGQGEPDAFDRLVPLVYAALKEVSHAQLRRSPGADLSTTELVHEAYLKMAPGEDVDWQSRGHFLGVAARAMRQILVDQARRRLAGKRGGDMRPVTLTDAGDRAPLDPVELIAMDEALDRLDALNPRLRQVVELRYFAGLREREIAETLGVTTRTVERDWVKARLFLRRELVPEGRDGAPG
jgi:RNA polymerase sigma factor (TIGR02999 family)